MLSEWETFISCPLDFTVFLQDQCSIFHTLEDLCKIGAVAFSLVVFQVAGYVLSKHPNHCITDETCIYQFPYFYTCDSKTLY